MATDKKNPHACHRERVKARFFSEGIDHFADHNLLEMVLFFAIPRKDTNEIAHRLLDRFGSLSGVFEANVRDLCEVEGIGEHAAFLLKTYPAVAKRYYADRFSDRNNVWNYEGIGKKLVIYYSGKNYEEVYAIFLDNSLSVCGEQSIHKGDINGAGFSLRKLAEPCVNLKASFVILAHNHPHGVPIASPDDLDTTATVRNFLAHMGVYLIDHFIIAEGKYSSIDRDGFRSFIKERNDLNRASTRKKKKIASLFSEEEENPR